MEGVNYIALAIPVFFALIGVEVLIARARGERLYRFNDSINDLSCGILQQVLGVFTKVIVFGGYVWLYESVHLLQLNAGTVGTWIVCFLGVDFFYYWFHRISHESNLPWGAHIVHHQSEEYNLSVALRQGTFQPLFSWLFYLPLAWIGFPPLVFLACTSFNTLYQFWIHTRTIDKLGPLEWVFNTPSHHRVHHGSNPKYIDRNHGGTLIIWDRMFGTFQAEEEEPTYGITKPLASWNPLWANVHYYADLARLSRQAPNWVERLKVWLMPPSWQPDWATDGLGAPDGPTPLTHGEAGKYDRRPPRGLQSYILLQFITAVAATVYFLFRAADLTLVSQLGLAGGVAWTLLNVGGLMDLRRWAILSEFLRLATYALVAVAIASGMGGTVLLWTAGLAALTFGILVAWMLRYRHPYLGTTGIAGRV